MAGNRSGSRPNQQRLSARFFSEAALFGSWYFVALIRSYHFVRLYRAATLASPASSNSDILRGVVVAGAWSTPLCAELGKHQQWRHHRIFIDGGSHRPTRKPAKAKTRDRARWTHAIYADYTAVFDQSDDAASTHLHQASNHTYQASELV